MHANEIAHGSVGIVELLILPRLAKLRQLMATVAGGLPFANGTGLPAPALTLGIM